MNTPVVRAHAWMTLASVVGFSASLPGPSRLTHAARALRSRFGDRDRFLGSFSTAPTCDPLGMYLAAIAEFQQDRSLATFWHRLCRLPQGVPPYHARYGLKGLRRLPAASPEEQGTLQPEVVMGLLALAGALDRLARHRRMDEPDARKTFQRLARPLVAAYPNSPRWAEHGLAPLDDLQQRPRDWVLQCVPALAEARRKAVTRGSPPRFLALARNPTWGQRVRDLMADLKAGHVDRVPDVEALLAEQRVHAQRSGDSDPLRRTLCNASSRILRSQHRLALKWAEEAAHVAPHDPFAWNTLVRVLMKSRMARALAVAWMTWKQFPDNPVAHNGLAEVLKAMQRLPEAEQAYRAAVQKFPDDPVAHTGLAVVTAVRGGDAGREAAERSLLKALELDPKNAHARNFLAKLRGQGPSVDEEVPGEGEPTPDDAHVMRDDRGIQAGGEDAPRGEGNGLAGAAEAGLGDLEAAWGSGAASAPPGPKGAAGGRSEVEVEAKDPKTADADAFARADGQEWWRGIEAAGLRAEASFLRDWASQLPGAEAARWRARALELLEQADAMAPGDPRVLAERTAWKMKDPSTAAELLTVALEQHPGCAPLLVLKARLDREEARRARRALSDASMAQLLQAPLRLDDLGSAYRPVVQLQRGLASLALLDGAVRVEKARQAFDAFRSGIAKEDEVEQAEARASGGADGSAGRMGFHGWLRRTTNAGMFRGLPDAKGVRTEDVALVEATWERTPHVFDEVEDMLVDRWEYAQV